MKIDRLLNIITILLQNEKVTAPYLAEKFEVSRRTISRDIEDICKAGIPVVTLQGVHGGICVADGYKISKAILTKQELRLIFAGLCGLESVMEDKAHQCITDKFFSNKTNYINLSNHIVINLASHYKKTLSPKIACIQKAILEKQKISFNYHSSKGEKTILLDPYLVVFQWSSWYVFGFENKSAEFRLFKLNRLCKLNIMDSPFLIQDNYKEKLNFDAYFTNEIQAIILFDYDIKYRLIDEYGHDCFVELDNKKLRFECPFTKEDYLLSWILSFGEKAELLAPKSLRKKLKIAMQKTLNIYK